MRVCVCECVFVISVVSLPVMSVTMSNLWWSDNDVSTRPIRLIPGVSCPHAPQDLRQLHAPGGGGGHDDHGQQARLQMCLHLRPVPGQPPAPIRDVHGSALWPLTCARRSFNVVSPFHSRPLSPALTPPPFPSPPDDQLANWSAWSELHVPDDAGGGLCMCVCVSVWLLSLSAVVMFLNLLCVGSCFRHTLLTQNPLWEVFIRSIFLSFKVLLFFVLKLFVPGDN